VVTPRGKCCVLRRKGGATHWSLLAWHNLVRLEQHAARPSVLAGFSIMNLPLVDRVCLLLFCYNWQLAVHVPAVVQYASWLARAACAVARAARWRPGPSHTASPRLSWRLVSDVDVARNDV
jgi:hypothetical protein